MCGKYYADREFIPRLSTLFREQGIAPDEELREEWEKVLLEDEDRQGSGGPFRQVADVSPTDRAVTISASDDGLIASKMRWGFRDPYHEHLVINARCESAAEKPMFAESVRGRRCVIPASGYYEWDRLKSRYRFKRPDGGLILLAGIYRQEMAEPHFTVLTAEANECMRPVHTRMPVTINADEIHSWITDRHAADEMLGRVQEELLRVQDSGQIAMDLGI